MKSGRSAFCAELVTSLIASTCLCFIGEVRTDLSRYRPQTISIAWDVYRGLVPPSCVFALGSRQWRAGLSWRTCACNRRRASFYLR
jgi:hypothetical protein